MRLRLLHTDLLPMLIIMILMVVPGWLLSRPIWSVNVDIGNEGTFLIPGETRTFSNFFGYHEPERADDGSDRMFRWSSSQLAAITFPFALRMRPLVLEVVLCGCRFDGKQTPMTLWVNGEDVAQVSATDEWRHYHVLLPSTLTHPDYGVMVIVDAPLRNSPEGRSIGVAVDTITVRQASPERIATLAGTLMLVVGLLVIRRWHHAIFLSLVLGGAWWLVHLVYVPQLLPRWLLVVILMAGMPFLWWVAFRVISWSSRGRVLVAMSMAFVAVWLVLSPQILGSWIIDDAFISFRYAQNLLNGHGLVFNAGERVEGYTNFLWTLIIATALAFGIDPIVGAATLTLVLAFIIIALTILLTERVQPGGWGIISAVLLAWSSPFLLYTTRGSGMETALFTALLMASLLALAHQAWRTAGVLSALTMLTRPDGILLVLAGGAATLLAGPSVSIRTRIERMGRYVGTFLLVFAPYFLWRWNYYGYLLPNTFYVKVGGTSAQLVHGSTYLLTFGYEHVLLFTAAVALFIGTWVTRVRQPASYPLLLVIGMVMLFSGYIVGVGGDWIPGARFGVPMLPLLALLTTWGIATVATKVPYRVGQWAVLLLLPGILILLTFRLPHDSSFIHTPIWTQNYAVRRYREIGRWIQEHTPPGTWIATGVAGAIPYYAERPTIDMLGLTDLHIAHLPSDHLGTGRPGHEKSDPDYVLGRRPDIITYKESYGLWGHPRLQAEYQLRSFPGPEGQAVWLYVRNDSIFHIAPLTNE